MVSSAVDDSLPACPDIGIDFDSCSFDIFSLGLVAALSLAVSAGFVPVCGGVGIAGGALEAGGAALVCGGGDGLSPQATSAAAVAIAIRRCSGRIIEGSRR